MESEHDAFAETSVESDLAVRSFSEYSCDDINLSFIMSGASVSHGTNPLDQTINEVLLHRAKFNTSYAATSNFANTLNSIPGSQLEIPTKKNQLKRNAGLQYRYEYYVFCYFCQALVKHGQNCSNCKRKTKKTKDNYFVYIPVNQQIKNSLKNHLPKIMDFLNQDRNEDVICDMFDASIYKKAKQKCDSILLPLVLNTDGAKIFTSSPSSLWPIQLVQSYLPPNIRFLSENILVVGLYCGNEKPDVAEIMLPLAEEMDLLRKNGLHVWHNNELLSFLPAIMYCACDLPARAETLNSKYSSGFYGCPSCLHKGVSVKNEKTGKSYVRYLKEEEASSLRTDEQSRKVSIGIASNSLDIDSHGLKGLSCMIAFKYFDLGSSFTVDWMHGSLLGIMKLLLDIWMGKKHLVYNEGEKYRFKCMSRSNRMSLHRRIISVKPPTRISHKPRSLLDRSFYTANEYRSLLWYYLKFALKGLLDHRIVEHFTLLSNATYILSKTRITREEIKEADIMLNRFADEFECIYGKNAITINIHSLRHYANTVSTAGPLWAHSLFTFESNMGELKRSFVSNVDVVEQIAFNYCVKRFAENFDIGSTQSKQTSEILRAKPIKVDEKFKKILVESGIQPSPTDTYFIGYEMSWRGQVLKSSSSTITKSVDYFIELKDKTIGVIEFFIQVNEDQFVLSREYEVINEYGHLKQVKRKIADEYQLSNCREIHQKLIFLRFNYSNVSWIEIATSEPNTFEGN